MKRDIILAGVGGQGILTIAAIIGGAALRGGLHIKQAEVHGMSQRGGDVHSNLRISSGPIHSDLIARGCADAILSLEPMEALRYVPWLSGGGWVVTASEPFRNIANYPGEERILDDLRALPNLIMVDADRLARENGTARSANIVLLGAASAVLGFDAAALEESIGEFFARKGADVVSSNLGAFRVGRAEGEKQTKQK